MRGSDNFDTPLFILQPEGDIRHLNESAKSLLKTESEHPIVGTSFFEYGALSHEEALLNQFKRIENGDAQALGLTIKLDTASAAPVDCISLVTAVEWNKHEAIQLHLFITDGELPSGLTAQTMNESPTGISIADATHEDEPLIYVNEEFCELTGYEREEALGQNCRFLQGEQTDEATVAEIRQAIDDEEPITTEIRNYRKHGTMFWNQLTITPITDDTGAVTHFLGFQEDISKQKLYEQQKELFEQQADAAGQVMFITDPDGTITHVNSEFERVTGYSADEAIGENPRLLKSDKQDDEFYQELWETINRGEVWEGELTNRRKSGELYRVTQKITPVTTVDGTVTHFVSIEEEVTDARFTEQVLNVMSRVLRHNVRNSTGVTNGYADLLEPGMDPEEHRATVQTIQEHADKLEKLSSETKAIRELFDRRHENHSLSLDEIEEFIETQRVAYPDITFDLSIEASKEELVQNGSLLKIAIDEAIENAVVHNDQDEPRVEIRVKYGADKTELCVEIADNGPGIPDDEWEVLLAGEETPLTHTTGIGLWLIYWTLTALGGTVERKKIAHGEQSSR